MDGLDKGVSSSTLKSPEIPRVSASDENHQSHQEMGSNIQNPNKLTPKHYMSPTISAAGKIVVPRKKILAERNEALESIFSDTHVQKTPILESKFTLVNPGFESEGNEENALVADGSLRPYNPSTNYLSPRPKFLRYNPERRREIFLRREKENGEEKDGLCVCTNGAFEFRKASDEKSEGSEQQEDEDIEESDEEFEEVEEERGRSLKRVLESLYCFVLLFLSTLYVSSSMVFPAPSPSLQSFGGFEGGGYCEIQNHTLEAFLSMKLESGSDMWDNREEILMGFDQVRQRAIGEGIEEEEIVEDMKMGGVEISKELSEVVYLEGVENEALEVKAIGEGIDEEEIVEDMKIGGIEISEELNEVVYLEGGENEEGLEVFEDEKKGAVDELGEVVEPQAEDIKDDYDQMAQNSEFHIIETIQKLEAFQDYHPQSTFDGVGHQVIESDIANILEEENVVLVEPHEEVVETKIEGLENVNIKAAEVLSTERIEIFNLEAAVIGVSVFSMIVAFLVLGFHFMLKKTIRKDSSLIPKPSSESLSTGPNKTIRNDSLIAKPCIESVIAEKHSSVLPYMEEVPIERVDDSFRSHSSFHPITKSSKDYYESCAPKIELLGELAVGEVSSSVRSCGLKNRRIENEDSNYFVSTEKSGSKADSVRVQSQPAFSEFSSMDAHSCGRYTAEKKIVKTQEGKDGEVKLITTPVSVRRSSRIRNRSVTSP